MAATSRQAAATHSPTRASRDHPAADILAYFSGVNASRAGDPTHNNSSVVHGHHVPERARAATTHSPVAAPGDDAQLRLEPDEQRRTSLECDRGRTACQLFVANPDVLGPAPERGTSGANYIHERVRHPLQLRAVRIPSAAQGGATIGDELRLRAGVRAAALWLPPGGQEILQSGTVGGVTHAHQGELGVRFAVRPRPQWANNLGTVMDRIVGGWQINGVGRIQTGELLDFGNVRLVGMTEQELRDSVDLRVASNGQLFILPDDVIQNTFKAFRRR